MMAEMERNAKFQLGGTGCCTTLMGWAGVTQLRPQWLAPFSDHRVLCRNTSIARLRVVIPPTTTMDRLLRMLNYVLVLLVPLTFALKFDLHAVNSHESARHERCIRNFVAKDQLVVVTAILDGYRGDGQTVNMHVCGIGSWGSWAPAKDHYATELMCVRRFAMPWATTTTSPRMSMARTDMPLPPTPILHLTYVSRTLS